MKTINHLQNRKNLTLLTDSQDTENLRAQFPDYDSFFVETKDGEYFEVWGFVGIVTYLSKSVSKLV